MASLRNVARWLLRHRFTLAFCAAVIGPVLFGTFSDHGTPWPFHTPTVLLAGGCPKTGCECIDDCIQDTYGSSGGTGSAGSASVRIERNLGQTDSRYPFVAQGARHSIRLAATEAVFDFPGSKHTKARTIRATVEGADAQVQGQAQEPMSGRVNYFLGNDPKRWVTGVPTFGRVTFPQIYPGIDLTYHGSGDYIENDFIVYPGADASRIQIHFDGADDVHLENDGSLTITAGRHLLRWKKPVVYQPTATGRKAPVEGRFREDPKGVVGFEIGVYDLKKPVVIDPLITYATYFGTANMEEAARVATDASGNAYIIGATDSPEFPVTASTYSASVDGGLEGDVMVAKLSADGKQMIFTTHIGGGNTQGGLGITLDATGNLYLTGFTASSDFPHTTDLTPGSQSLNTNCFVTKLNPQGSAIIYSTLIGGSNQDGCTGIGVDSAGNAYVVGATASTDFPTVNAVQPSLQGSVLNMFNSDAFVAKLNPAGTKLLYSTYLGGSYFNLATAVAVDAAGNAYLTGYTTSSNFPVSSNAFQPAYAGAGGQFDPMFASGDAFVVKMSPTGTIVYSTFLGGSKDDAGWGIAIDAQGDAYIGGSTLSQNFPTLNPFQAAYGGYGGETNPIASAAGDIFYGGDGFVAELNPTGTALIFSSYLGGKLDDRVVGIAVDSTGNIWVTGQTLSQNFPVTPNAPQATNAGDNGGTSAAPQLGDAFLTEIGTSHTIVFSTFLGGSSADWASGIAIDGLGGVIIAGGTASVNFPASQGAYQTKYAGTDVAQVPAGDAIIARFGGSIPAVSISGLSNAASYAGGAIAPGEAVLVSGSGIGPATLTTAQLTSSGNVSASVANTQITFNGVPAPIVYVSQLYTTVIVPYEVASSPTAQVVATVNNVPSPPVTVSVIAALPGIFSADASGTGQGAIFNQDLSHNSAKNPAARGSTVILYVTGEGQTIPGGVDGQVTGAQISPVLPVTVLFGGVAATNYAFVGEAPGEVAGVMQINVTVPTLAPTGSTVPIVVTVGSAMTQSGLTVAIQ